jgi:hypothetical protein
MHSFRPPVFLDALSIVEFVQLCLAMPEGYGWTRFRHALPATHPQRLARTKRASSLSSFPLRPQNEPPIPVSLICHLSIFAESLLRTSRHTVDLRHIATPLQPSNPPFRASNQI